MAINFCHPAFQPRITTTAVTSDGYGVDNLTRSSENILQVRGFMAEYFIKPPVDVTFEFPCNILLDQIVIDPNLGAQKSCGFELFTKSIPMNKRDTWLFGKKTDDKKQCTNDNHGMPIADVATPIGKVFFKDNEIKQVCFVNRQFRPKAPFRSSTKSVEQHGTVVRELRHHLSQALANVSHLVLRISRVFSGCVPALGKVEIYGQPANSCGREIESNVIILYQSLFSKTKSRRKETSSSECLSLDTERTSEKQFPTELCATSIPEFPADYADPITCEMMSLPVLLPSGHTIDQSTLDKHIATEANWGRKANDPFTGIEFTENSKPVPNVKLKARIDQFLLKADVHLKMVPRTVGRASDLHNMGIHGASKMNSPLTAKTHCSGSADQVSVKTGNQDIHQPSQSNADQISKQSCLSKNIGSDMNQSKQKCGSSNLQNTVHSMVELSAGNKQQRPEHLLSLKGQKRNLGRAVGKSHLTSKKVKLDESMKSRGDTMALTSVNLSGQAVDHEKRLALSLDDALRNTLGTMKSFRRTDQGSTQAPERNVCSLCSVSLSSSSSGSPAYTIPCGHLLCRQCLLSLKGSQRSAGDLITCDTCQRSYPSNQVTRTHMITS